MLGWVEIVLVALLVLSVGGVIWSWYHDGPTGQLVVLALVFFVAASVVLPVLKTSRLSPLPSPTAQAAVSPAAARPEVKVWIDLEAGLYHCPAAPYYRNTARGKEMTQAQAQRQGFRPAFGKVCQ